MSISRFISLWCDADECDNNCDTFARYAPIARRRAAEEGWTSAPALKSGWDRRDFCPEHS